MWSQCCLTSNLASGRTWRTIIARQRRRLVSVFARIDWRTRRTGVRLGRPRLCRLGIGPVGQDALRPTPGSLWRWAHWRSSSDSGEPRAEGPAARSPKWRRMHGSACRRSTRRAARTAWTGAWSQDCARGSTPGLVAASRPSSDDLLRGRDPARRQDGSAHRGAPPTHRGHAGPLRRPPHSARRRCDDPGGNRSREPDRHRVPRSKPRRAVVRLGALPGDYPAPQRQLAIELHMASIGNGGGRVSRRGGRAGTTHAGDMASLRDRTVEVIGLLRNVAWAWTGRATTTRT